MAKEQPQDNVPAVLSDQTAIMDISWGDLKAIAMKPDFSESKMFTSYTSEDNEIVLSLIALQKAQGDMGPLLSAQDRFAKRSGEIASEYSSSFGRRRDIRCRGEGMRR